MSNEKFCTVCNGVGTPKNNVKGSFILEVVLWLVIFPVGFIYTVWRRVNKIPECRHCGSTSLISLESPKAIQMLSKK